MVEEVTDELISANEAARRGIERLRQPNWISPYDHIKIDILEDGTLGPWLHLFSPQNTLLVGHDPHSMLWALSPGTIDNDKKCLLPYSGPLPDDPEYRAAASAFQRQLKGE